MDSKSTQPGISVLMSCYNSAKWLHEAIASVLNQSYKEFEFIIIDDGSSDDTLKIIQDYAKRDDRIVVVVKPNTGLTDSLNVGIKMANGAWIARIDADDVCESDRLLKQYRLATSNSNIVFIGTGLTQIDAQGNALNTYYYPSSHTSLVRNLVTARKFPPHSSAFYSTEAARGIGGYRTRIKRAQDWDLWLRLSEIGKLTSLDESLVRIRQHADQISYAEAGRRQKIDCRVAIVGYWLRSLGYDDPVNLSQHCFEDFRGWINAQLEEDGLFDFYDYKARIKVCLNSVSMPSQGISRLIYAICAKPKFLVRLLNEWLVGENLSRILASKWIKQTKSCAES